MWHPTTAAAIVALATAPAEFSGAALPGAALSPVSEADCDGRHIVVDADGVRHRLWLTGNCGTGSTIILFVPSNDDVRIAATDCARALLAGGVSLLAGALSPSAFQRHRLALLLAILDASLAGASARWIGHEIVYPRLAGQSAAVWKASNERRQIQRLIAEAKAMSAGRYRALLGGDQADCAQG